MVEIPEALVQAIQAGDCVLWAGAGFGAVAGRPGWGDLLATLVEEVPEADAKAELEDLLEQGRLRTALSYVHRHRGDGPLAELLRKVSAGARAGLGPDAEALARDLTSLRWRAIFATTYADVIWELYRRAGMGLDVISHQDVHDLSLRDTANPFILRTPPTGRSMRADRVFFDLVEEVLRTRTILFVGFDPDDPDLHQILALLDRVGRSGRHYAWMPYVSDPEAEELLERHELHVIHADPEESLHEVFRRLRVAHDNVAPRPSTADVRLAALDLARAVHGLELRADLAADVALGLDIENLEHLIERLPGRSLADADPRTALRSGNVLFAHGRVDAARRVYQQVISRGVGREYAALARFNLGLSAIGSDNEGAVDGLLAAAELDRTLALVPPRFEITGVLSSDGVATTLACRDREKGTALEITIGAQSRAASDDQHRRFYEAVGRVVELSHPAIQSVRGGFADGRLFGIFAEPTPGFSLATALVDDERPMDLDRAFEIVGPLMEALAYCHGRSVVHAQLHPRQVLLTPMGSMLVGFGFPPLASINRPVVRRNLRGYVAPEVLAGARPSPASDVYGLFAVFYRCLTGRPPSGGTPRVRRLNESIDARIEALVAAGLDPDPGRRPDLATARLGIATLVANPRAEVDFGDGIEVVGPAASTPPALLQAAKSEIEAVRIKLAQAEQKAEQQGRELAVVREELETAKDDLAAAGVMSRGEIAEELQAANERLEDLEAQVLTAHQELERLRADTARGVPVAAPDAATPAEGTAGVPQELPPSVTPLPDRIELPENPDDLEAWTWILERKPTHVEARAAVERIENESRVNGRWDRVADVLSVRVQLSQVQADRLVIVRDLVGVLERELGAPASALEALEGVLPEQSLAAQLELAEDVLRLGEQTGSWSAVTELLEPVASAAPPGSDRVAINRALARIYLEELGAAAQAVVALQRAVTPGEVDVELLRQLADALRRTGRHADLAQVLVDLAELDTGSDRHDDLVAAAEVLAGPLEDPAAALDALELVRAEEPQHPRALELVVDLAAQLDRWSVLAPALERHAEQVEDPERAVELLLQAAEIYEGELEAPADAARAIATVLDRRPDDLAAGRRRLELLVRNAGDDPEEDAELVDALIDFSYRTEDPDERTAVLERAADLLDRVAGRDADAMWRAADARLRILDDAEQAPPERVVTVVTKLAELHRREERWDDLARIFERGAGALRVPDARRIRWLESLLDLRRGPLDDRTGLRETLEELVRLDPEQPRWRDELLTWLVDEGEQAQAQALIDTQLEGAQGKARGRLLLASGRLAVADGRLDEAEVSLEAASELVGDDAAVWQALAALHRQAGRPLRALETEERAARLAATPGERARRLFEVAQEAGRLEMEPARIVELLAAVCELDPDHRDATREVVDRLVAMGDLERAWPFARVRVTQSRVSEPHDPTEEVQALAIAGRCATAVDQQDQARDYLARANELDARDLAVRRLLADLELAAEHWAEAVQHYQAVLMGDRDLDDAAQADLYTRLAQARDGLGERGKALTNLDRALELDPDFEPAARLMLRLGQTAGPEAEARARIRLAELLGRRADRQAEPEDGPEREEEVELLRRAAELLADELGKPEEAIRRLERVLDRRPGDPAVLHQLLDLHSSSEHWDEAVDVLESLAELQEDGRARGKYLYAAAVLVRDHLGDELRTHRMMGRVLDADPRHEKAFRVFGDGLRSSGAHRELSRVIRERLKALPEDASGEERRELLEQLADLYEQHLDDMPTAMAAHETIIGLLEEPAERVQRRRRVLDLALTLGEDQYDKAIEMGQGIIAERPMDFETYHRLVQLYGLTGSDDEAACVARALRFLKQASPEEEQLAASIDGGATKARGTFGAEQWRDVLHPLEHARITELFGAIWHVVAVRQGQTHAHFGVERGKHVPVSLQSSHESARLLAYACQLLDVPVPELFERPGDAGGFAVYAPFTGDAVVPTLLAGGDVMARQAEHSMAFRAGRAASRAMPGHILAALLARSGTALRDAMYGAAALALDEAQLPEGTRNVARSLREDLRRHLPPAVADRAGELAARLVDGGHADVTAWAQGVDHTCSRVGYLLSDSLEVSARILSAGASEGAIVPGKDLVKDLVAFTVSEPYFRLRRALKLSRS